MSLGTKKTIAAAAGWLAFFAALCVVDGMDRFIVPIGRGAALVFVLTAVWAFGLYKAGWIRLPGPKPGEAGADRRGEARADQRAGARAPLREVRPSFGERVVDPVAALKTCPFCRGAGRLRPWVGPGRSERDPFWVVCCDDCGSMTWPYTGKEEAVRFWQRRVGERAAPEEQKRLCISCRYSESSFGKLYCMGQREKSEVRASDRCDAWKPEGEA